MDGSGGFRESGFYAALDSICIIDSINHNLGSRKTKSLKIKRSKQAAIFNPQKRKKIDSCQSIVEHRK